MTFSKPVVVSVDKKKSQTDLKKEVKAEVSSPTKALDLDKSVLANLVREIWTQEVELINFF